MNNEALKSATGPGDSWCTPQDLFDEIIKRFLPGTGPVFDPCPNPMRILTNSAVNLSLDALLHDWYPNLESTTRGTFVNPPFSNITPFILPAFESACHEKPVVLLVPSRTDTPWWHTAMALGKVINIRGRVNYVNAVTGLPGKAPSFASSLLLFGQGIGIESWWPACHQRRGRGK